MTDVVQDERGGADSAVDQVRERVQGAAQDSKSAVGRAVSDRLDSASAQAATQLEEITSAFRRTSHQLRGEGKDQPAQVIETVTDRTGRLADYLSASGSSQILDDLERLGRTRPWLAIAGGLGAGLFAARLLKSSSRHRFDDYRERYPNGYPMRSPDATETSELPVVPAPRTG